MKNLLCFYICLLVSLSACSYIETETSIPPNTLATAKIFPTSMPEIWIGDAGLISGSPCLAPCFFGIQTEQNIIDDVISILKENGMYPCTRDSENTVVCDNVSISANPSTGLIDGIGYYPDNKISIKEIIDLHGVPDVIEVIPTSTPETPKTVVLLMFEKLNMRILLPEIDGREYKVEGSTSIEFVNYFDSATYLEMNEGMYFQQWSGYGVYNP